MSRRSVCKLCLVALAAATLGAAVAAKPDPHKADEAAIREVVQLYFDGIIKYEEESLRNAFHPQANVIGTTDDGNVDWEPFQEWVLYTRGDAPDPTGRVNRIVSVDISGRAAVVKTDLDWPHVHYIDYLSLLKVGGEWKVVNKIWHREKPVSPR